VQGHQFQTRNITVFLFTEDILLLILVESSATASFWSFAKQVAAAVWIEMVVIFCAFLTGKMFDTSISREQYIMACSHGTVEGEQFTHVALLGTTKTHQLPLFMLGRTNGLKCQCHVITYSSAQSNKW
jgi:hypothetical protein